MIQLKTFTDQQNARKFRGEIVQAIAHVLKLMYGYDYSRDRLKHIKDIVGWTKTIAEYISSDDHAQGAFYMVRYFDKEFPFNKNKQRLQTILKRYDPSRIISRPEYVYAESLIFQCIEDRYEEEIYDKLIKLFPKTGFDDWISVEEGKDL